MDIKVGEYGRTNKGNIFIYANVVDEKGNKLDYIIKLVDGRPIKYYLSKDEQIVKHSFNLIDLIEVKDIVVMLDTKFNTKDYIFIDDKEMLKAVKEDLKDRCKLLEVLTHEQFEVNAYKVKGEE